MIQCCEDDNDRKPRAISLENLTKLLERKGRQHRSLYHYTQWESFAKMMRPVEVGPCAGHLMMLLSPADRMNDKVEKGWGKNVFMTCFSYSKYEDVAMWMNYGKRSPNAVRVRIDGDAVSDWYRENRKHKHEIFRAIPDGNGGYKFEKMSPDEIALVELADVAYVIHRKLMSRHHWGNVEYRRKLYQAMDAEAGLNWSDEIYNGDLDKVRGRLPAYFKKRGWGYERETRLVITLKDGVPVPDRIGIIFDGPFRTLSAVSAGQCPPRLLRGDEDLEERGRHSIMRGPWYRDNSGSSVAAGVLRLSEVAYGSDYESEIDIISAGRMSISELVVQADRRLRELDGHASNALSSDDGAFLRVLGHDLISAAKSINAHVDCGDYKANLYKIARLEIIDSRRLAELSLADEWAAEYLNVLRKIVESKSASWRTKIRPNVRKYGHR